MKKLVNRWKIPLVATVLSGFATVFALDFVAIDATVEPPEAVSVSGRVVSCERTADGLALTLEGGNDALLAISGVPDGADLRYAVISLDGSTLVEGDGPLIPLAEVAGLATVLISSSNDGFDPSSVKSVSVSTPDISMSAISPPETGSRTSSASGLLGDASTGAVDGSPTDIAGLAIGLADSGVIPGYTLFSYNEYEYAPYHSNVFARVIGGAMVTPPVSGIYMLSLSSDDTADVMVGEISAHSALFQPASATGALYAGEVYSIGGTWNNIGGPAHVTCSVKLVGPFSETNGVPPRLVIDPGVIRVVLKGGVPVFSAEPSISAVGGTDGKQYEILCVQSPQGLSYANGTMTLTDAAALANAPDGNLTAVFNLVGEDGMVADSGYLIYVISPETTEETEGSSDGDPCGCSCSEGTEVKSDSVSFSQRFGRTPEIPGLPIGRLRIHESSPTTRLSSPRALFYDHPMERRVVWQSGTLNAIISSPSGYCTEYRNGMPVNSSVGLDRGISRDADGFLVERLSSGMRVAYDAFGAVRSLQPVDSSVPIAVTNLGIVVSRDEYGAVTNIFSEADGNMAVETLSENSFRVLWTAPSGAAVKTYTFARPSATKFTLRESRGEPSGFDYEWNYSGTALDWTLTRAPGTEDEVREEKNIVFDPVLRTWSATRGWRSGDGEPVDVRTSAIAVGSAPRRTGESAGRMLYSAMLGSNGRVSSETNALGQATTYAYDGWGRVVSTSRTVRGGLSELVSYFYDMSSDGGIVDFRPIRETRTVSGIVVSETEWERGTNRTEVTRRFGDDVRTSFSERDAWGRTLLNVGEDGLARRTEYDPAVPSGGGWTETQDIGVWDSTNGFSAVSGRSTRTVTVYDASGNAVLTERYALIDGIWREIGREERTYNATHKVTSTSRSNGKSSSAAWICTGPVWTIGEDGIATTNSYDRAKRLASSTRYGRHGAVTTSYIRDAADRVVSETHSADGVESQTETASYDAEGRVTSRTDAQGLTTTYAYSADGRTTTVTLPTGGTRETTLNADGSVASVTGTAVTPEFYTYGVTTNGLEWAKVNYISPDGARWTKTYVNGFGETVKEEHPGANGSILTTKYAYNSKGQLAETTATAQPTETRSYDDFGDLATVTRSADGQTRTVETDSLYALDGGEVWRVASRRVSCSDPAIPSPGAYTMTQVSGLSLSNESRRVTIDARGNATTEWTVFDPTTSMRITYEAIPTAANIAETVEVDGFATLSVSHSAVTNSASCDAYRRTVSMTDGRGNETVRAYDALGRIASVTDAATNTTAYAYDSAGRVAAVTNALGIATTYEYDIRGSKIFEGGGTYPVAYAYDQFNVMTNMTTYRNENAETGDATSWLYDEATGLLQQKLYADGHGVCYNYSDDGKLTTRIWARGVTTTYSYDGWNQLTNTVYSDGTPSVSLAYDAMGRQTSATDAAGTTTFAYTPYGEPLSETWGGLGNRVLLRHYDAYGRSVGYSAKGTRRTTIGYDAATGRLSTMNEGGNFSWSYLPGTDLKSQVVYPNGVTVDYTYEPNRDLLTNIRNYRGDTIYSEYAYMNDALGRRTAKNAETFGYNDRNELTSASGGSQSPATEYLYSYDDIGNRLSASEQGDSTEYTANVLNQYTAIDDFTPTYDLDGNQTLVKTSTGVWTVEYNGENRPVTWTRTNDNTVVTMDFDRMGRRTFYKEMKGNTQVTFTRFFYDGYLMIQQLFSNSPYNIYKEFIWDPTEPVATKPLCFRQNGKTATFYTHDGNKNVSDVISVSPYNQRTAHYEYAPFGAVTSAVGWRTTDNPYRFSSEFHDDTLGLVYYNYRHYNPKDGRWMSRDLISELFAKNLCAFTRNSTITIFDFLGLKDCCECGSCEVIILDDTAKVRINGFRLARMIGGDAISFEDNDVIKDQVDELINEIGGDVLKKSRKIADNILKLIMIALPSANVGYTPEFKLSKTIQYKKRTCARDKKSKDCDWLPWQEIYSTLKVDWTGPNDTAFEGPNKYVFLSPFDIGYMVESLGNLISSAYENAIDKLDVETLLKKDTGCELVTAEVKEDE